MAIRRRAMELRKNGTEAERALWRHLRFRQLSGCKFRRQQPIGGCVADLVCLERRLVIELDGGQHMEQATEDNERDEWLRREGFRVIRFWNNDVMREIDGVMETIQEALGQNGIPPHLDPPPRGGRKRKAARPKAIGKLAGLAGLAMLVVLGGNPALAATVDEDPTEAKVREIAKELRCAVCQNESVYDSRSDLAVQMKELIRDRLKAGESPESIRKYFVSRYGDYILLEPRRQGLNWIIWVGPTAAFLAASGVLFVYLRRRVRRDRPSAGAPVDPKLKKRLQQEIEKLPDEDVP